VTPEQIAASALDAAAAGAAVVHLHVRDPETGAPSRQMDLYREVVERIRVSDPEVVINLTTGYGARYVPGDDDPLAPQQGTNLTAPHLRCDHVVALRPDICSLDMGSMNFNDTVFVNTPRHLELMAHDVCSAGVIPELEVFEPGHIRLAQHMIAQGTIAEPGYFQLCLGVAWGSPATPRSMQYLVDLLPSGSRWSAFGLGPAQFPMVAQAVLLGGNVRVGLEDNLYLERGKLAPSNAALVERAARILSSLDGRPATPAEAREILGVGQRADRQAPPASTA
jgi:uncharacterized protein (DUF849 family)